MDIEQANSISPTSLRLQTKLSIIEMADQLIVLESTSYPGTTEEIPLLSRTKLCVGKAFSLAFSPERIDPDNMKYNLEDIPKVIGGINAESADFAVALYNTIVNKTVVMNSVESAERVRLLENMFRAVNIALVNEFAQIINTLEIDIWEVLQAATTNPFGFMRFYPGPGFGGHCIPVDSRFSLSCLEAALDELSLLPYQSGESHQHRNAALCGRPDYTRPQRVRKGRVLRDAHILLLGVVYKCNSADVCEFPAIDAIALLCVHHASIPYADTHVPEFLSSDTMLYAIRLNGKAIQSTDYAVIITNHSDVGYTWVAKYASFILDTQCDLSCVGLWFMTILGD